MLSNFPIQRGEASTAHNIGMLAGQHSGEQSPSSSVRFSRGCRLGSCSRIRASLIQSTTEKKRRRANSTPRALSSGHVLFSADKRRSQKSCELEDCLSGPASGASVAREKSKLDPAGTTRFNLAAELKRAIGGPVFCCFLSRNLLAP